MIQDFIKKYKIKQIYESSSIDSLNLDMKYANLEENTIFYGVYTNNDIATILNHKGKKWILWAGQDANIKYESRLEVINLMKKQNIENHLVKNINVEKNLLLANIMPININSNLNVITNLERFLIANNINQISVSKSIDKPKFKFVEINNYKDKKENTLFYGMYQVPDIMKLKSHEGKKWVLWTGNDANIEYKKRVNIIKIVNDLPIEGNLVKDKLENNLKSLGFDVINVNKPSKINVKDLDKIQIKVSSQLKNFENILIKKYNLKEYKSKDLPTLFVGLYDLKDIIEINAHISDKYLLWGGKDTNFDDVKFKFNLLGIENLKDINHIAFSEKIYLNLNNQNITSKIIELDDNILHGKNDLLEAEEDHKKTIDNLKAIKFDKSILINSSSNLNLIAGDTIWMSNLCNTLNCNITIITKYKLTNDSFIKNIENPDNIDIKYYDNIVDFIDINIEKFDSIIIRNNDLLDAIKNKDWLYKTTIYGLDVHLNGIKNLKNKFKELWTQSEKLKQLFVDNGINEKKIVIKEPYAYKYNFDLPKRKDNEIRLIYCGTLRDEENILEIIEEFKKIHKERPEIVLKIIYGKFHGNKDFILKVNNHIKNGVDGITFKTKLSHKDACYEIATSDIGICWRKNRWGDDGKVSTKVKEYEMYGLCVCNVLKNLFIYTNINCIINKKIESKNLIILNNKKNKDNLYVKIISDCDNTSTLQFLIDNKQLIESNVLLSKHYITPNYIDNMLFPNYKHIHIYGKFISHIIIENISFNDIGIENNYQLSDLTDIKLYKKNKIFLNNIAFIGDTFTFNSLNNIININYISKKDIDTIDINLYDFLLCESTWHGMDNSWKYAFNLYKNNKYSIELKKIILKFKENNKKCIFYNKEDPTNFSKFYNSAELFDIIITTSKECVEKYKIIYPNKIIFDLPFLCNPIIHNPINNKMEKNVYFVGGFYNNFTERTKNTNKLLNDVIRNNYNLIIINRHYFFPKLTRQIYNFKQHQNKYEIAEAFKKFENPSVSHNEAINIYKNSLFHLNINTVTNCRTMSSRRLIELLACGCNVFSNPSKSIEYLELPVFTDIKQVKEFDIINEFNINGFYKIHTKYSYVSLINKILTLSNISCKNNVIIKISCNDKTKIPERYNNLLNLTKFDFELFINDDDYYNTEIIEKLLVYPYFFNGNVCFTNDKNKYFTVENNLISKNCIIKYYNYKNLKQTLFIPIL